MNILLIIISYMYFILAFTMLFLPDVKVFSKEFIKNYLTTLIIMPIAISVTPIALSLFLLFLIVYPVIILVLSLVLNI